MKRSVWMRNYLPLTAIGGVMVVYACALAFLQPDFRQGVYPPAELSTTSAYDPFPWESKGYIGIKPDANNATKAWMNMSLGYLHPSLFRMKSSSCPFKLTVNGMEQQALPCNGSAGADVNLSGSLVTGVNELVFEFQPRTTVTTFMIWPSPWDPFVFAAHFSAFALLVLLISLYVQKLRLSPSLRSLIPIVTIGVGVRFAHLLVQPVSIGAYDGLGHLQYVFAVMRDWMIPHYKDGWEYFQPPLYYFFTAVVALPTRLLNFAVPWTVLFVQWQSFILACIALIASLGVGWMLFPGRWATLQRLCFGAFVALLPGVAFFSSRISNDTFMLLIYVLYIAALMRYWQRRNMRDWWASFVLVMLGILTKSTAIPLLAPLFLCLLLRRPSRGLGKVLAGSLMLLLLCTGWYFVLRHVVEGQSSLVGNIERNSRGLFTEAWSPWNLVKFHPLANLRTPHYSNWSDDTNRQFMLDVLFKSAHTGEWNFGLASAAVLRLSYVLAYLLFPLGLLAFLWNIVRRPSENFPLWSTSIVVIASVMALQMLQHNGGLQDFRYVTVLALPAAYYTLRGVWMLPRTLRFVGIGILLLYLASLLFFHVTLFFS